MKLHFSSPPKLSVTMKEPNLGAGGQRLPRYSVCKRIPENTSNLAGRVPDPHSQDLPRRPIGSLKLVHITDGNHLTSNRRIIQSGMNAGYPLVLQIGTCRRRSRELLSQKPDRALVRQEAVRFFLLPLDHCQKLVSADLRIARENLVEKIIKSWHND